MNKMFKNALAISLFFIVSLSVSFGISQMSASPANAAAVCDGQSMCISIHKGWVGKDSSSGKPNLGNGPGGGGGGGGGGNSTVVKPTPIKCVGSGGGKMTYVKPGQGMPNANTPWKRLSGCVPQYSIDTTFVPFAKPGGWCGVGPDGVKAVGYINNAVSVAQFAQREGKEGDLIPGVFYAYKMNHHANNCVYPKVTSTNKSKYCAISATGTLDRLANSRAGAARVKSFKQTVSSVSKILASDSACVQSTNMNFQSGLKSNPNTWGQYKLSGNIQFVRCTEYTVKFDGKSRKEYSKCSGIQNSASAVAYATLWCGGETLGRLNKSWTMNDCLKGKSGVSGGYTCTVPKPTFDGKTGTVQTLRDGKSRVLNWGSPKTSSNVRKTTGWEQVLTINSGSSPRNTSVSDNSKSQQYFWSNVNFGSGWAKRVDKQDLAFYNASNPGGSFSATKKMRFDGEFKTKVGNIDSYNPWTGKVKTSSRTVWVKDYNISCNTATSPKVQVLRSVGDAQ